jgi:predicted component of type VI protein secretion system
VRAFELLEERGEVVRALITVLSDLLRARANDLSTAGAAARLPPTDA